MQTSGSGESHFEKMVYICPSQVRGLGLGLGPGAIQESWCLGSCLGKVESHGEGETGHSLQGCFL